MKTIGVISRGPVASKSDGTLTRIFHLVKSLSKFGKVKLFELSGGKEVFFEDKKVKEWPLDAKIESTDSFFRIIKNEFSIFKGLIKNQDELKSCDMIFVAGTVSPSAIFVSRMLSDTLVLDIPFLYSRVVEENFAKRSLGKFIEALAMKASDRISFISDQEKAISMENYSLQEKNLFVVPHVVEVPSLKFRKDLNEVENLPEITGKKVLTFIGDLNAVQNKDSVEFILNDLVPSFQNENVVFLIIGKGKEEFEPKSPNVRFLGFVEELSPYLEITDICIAPLRVGAGIKTKILDYLKFEKPVLTTVKGAEGFDFQNLEIVKVCDIENFEFHLRDMLKNLNEFKGEKGRKFIKENHSKKVSEDKIEELLSSLD
ncbi:hypothetical protein AKJ55_00785 [candidate division MSBL1 archaeon SCGC-AAA382M17]|uniref:Glycosyltransferase subfamily 4-like N-terminal domain-containing protein n=1 Tax=candidate division MSBL1 archaeon SCGC-AAA382M17 TaxID=1698284 RepID=A0ABR5TJT8_9EURY|nr:hypothetical protein AKJ55_00785 [candidate division MSBL1 archaeon SCGC-AAA382M17]